jgi:hypothetical protein
VERTRAAGRRTLISESWDQPAPVAFAKAVGLERGSDEVQRFQQLPALDWDRIDSLHAEAKQAARDYELVLASGPVGPDLVDAVVTLTAAINDAPIENLDIVDEVFSPERVAEFDRMQDALGRRVYRVMARERATGEMAGHTVMCVHAEFPWLASQYDTSVLRQHRGHRLGLWLKIEMLRWLAQVEPQVRSVRTWNTASNSHMIDVNEALGYQVAGHAVHWQAQVAADSS